MDRNKRARGGRPSKGPRDAVMTRPPEGVKPRLEAIAKALDTSVSEYLAERIVELLPEWEQEAGIAQSNQDVLNFDLKTG